MDKFIIYWENGNRRAVYGEDTGDAYRKYIEEHEEAANSDLLKICYALGPRIAEWDEIRDTQDKNDV